MQTQQKQMDVNALTERENNLDAGNEQIEDLRIVTENIRKDLALKANLKDVIAMLNDQQPQNELFDQLQSTYDQFIEFK